MHRKTIISHIDKMLETRVVEPDVLREIKELFKSQEEEEENPRFVRMTRERFMFLIKCERLVEKARRKILDRRMQCQKLPLQSQSSSLSS